MSKIYLVILSIAFTYNVKAIDICSFSKFPNTKTEKNISVERSMEFEYSFIEGIKFKLLGNYKMAIKWFYRCLEIDRSSSVVRYEIANMYISNKEFDKAIPLLKDAVHYNSSNSWYKLQLAFCYKEKAMINKACDIYNSLYKNNPDKIDYLYYQASLFASAEKWRESIKVYKRIEKIIGITEQVSIEKYKIYTKLGKYNKAEKEIELLTIKYPSSSKYLALLADVYINNEKSEKVLSLFEKMIELDPDNGYYYFIIADYYKQSRDITNYKKYITQAIKKRTVDSDFKVQYLIKLFVSSQNIGIDKSFIGILLNELIELYPNDISVLSLQVDVLKAEGHYDMARNLVLKILTINKHNYLSWESLILLDNQVGDFINMKKDSEEAIKYFPEKPLPYILNGICYMLSKDFNYAIRIFEKGATLVENNDILLSQFYSYQADCLYSLKLSNEAFALYDKVLELDPSNIVVLNNYSYYLSLEDKDLNKAESMILKCIEVEVNNPTYLDTYAWILYKKAKYSDALFYIEKVMNLIKDKSSVLLEHYGDILFMNNKVDDAIKAWTEAMKYGEGSGLLDQKIKNKKLIK